MSQAGTYVEMKTELAKLQLYKDQLQSLKGDLTNVPKDVWEPGWVQTPQRMGQLRTYLSSNDCTKTVAKDACYSSTRLILIATTKELDEHAELINSLRATVDRLVNNLDQVIDTVNSQNQPSK